MSNFWSVGLFSVCRDEVVLVVDGSVNGMRKWRCWLCMMVCIVW